MVVRKLIVKLVSGPAVRPVAMSLFKASLRRAGRASAVLDRAVGGFGREAGRLRYSSVVYASLIVA